MSIFVNIVVEPSSTKVLSKYLPQNRWYPKRYDIANYMLWRKAVIHYHFLNTEYSSSTKRKIKDDYSIRYTKNFIRDNKSYKEAMKLFDMLESEIIESAMKMANHHTKIDQFHQCRLYSMIKLSINTFYAWCSYKDIPPTVASIYQSKAIYVALKYALDFGFDDRDFQKDGRFSSRAMRIFARLFIEQIIDNFEIEKEYKELQQIFTLIRTKEYLPSNYTFGRRL